MHIALLCTELPPKLNGIGDYTYYLAQQLAQANLTVTLLSGAGDFLCPPGCTLDSSAYTPGSTILQSLPKALHRSNPDWLVIQYNPFMYARRGFNPWLVAAIQQAKQTNPKLKIALMAHELFMPPDNFKFAVMGAFQRLQLWVLLSFTEVVFTSIERWAQMIQPWNPKQTILPVPVGSNIPVQNLSETAKLALRNELGIPQEALIIGTFGSAHYGRMQGLVLNTFQSLRSAGYPVHLLFIGSGSAELQSTCPPTLLPFLHTTGFVEPIRASHYLQIIEIFLAPFLDGISARRTSAISGLAHGLPVLSNYGHATDAFWRIALPTSLVTVEDEVGWNQLVLHCVQDPKVRMQLAKQGHDLYLQRFTWPGIAEQMVAALVTHS